MLLVKTHAINKFKHKSCKLQTHRLNMNTLSYYFRKSLFVPDVIKYLDDFAKEAKILAASVGNVSFFNYFYEFTSGKLLPYRLVFLRGQLGCTDCICRYIWTNFVTTPCHLILFPRKTDSLWNFIPAPTKDRRRVFISSANKTIIHQH